MSFATSLNCMDGRTQIPVFEAVRSIFGVENVDTITEAGIVRFLTGGKETRETAASLASIRISIEKHASTSIAVTAHADCAGNPIPDEEQQTQLRTAVDFLRGRFPECRVVGLWVGSDWTAKTLVD